MREVLKINKALGRTTEQVPVSAMLCFSVKYRDTGTI